MYNVFPFIYNMVFFCYVWLVLVDSCWGGGGGGGVRSKLHIQKKVIQIIKNNLKYSKKEASI